MQVSQVDTSTSSAAPPYKNGAGGWLITLYVVLSSALLLLGPGGIARLFFLAGAGLIGFILCKRNPPLYVSFVLWLWFLNPFVRRLLDYRVGWLDSDPILAASLLATLACFPRVCGIFLGGKTKGSMPFVLALSAVGYGFLVGFFSIPPKRLLLESANWACPIIFGLYVFFEYADEEKRAQLAKAFESTFKWGLLVTGAYSIVQFTILPAWDVMWLLELDNPAFGTAEPFGVRVFSTMASPVPLAVAAFVGLILLMRQRGLVPILATIAGYGSLALSSVRSAWGLWALGTALILFWQKRERGRFLLIIATALGLLVLSTAFQPVRDVLQKRIETLSHLSSDGSLQDRKSGYEQLYYDVVSNPLGFGLGGMQKILNTKQSDIGGNDSGVLEIALSLGWVGGAVYFFALAVVVWSGLKGGSTASTFEIAACAISVAIVSHMVLESISSGLDAIALWSFAGINIAAQLHRRQQASANPPKFGLTVP